VRAYSCPRTPPPRSMLSARYAHTWRCRLRTPPPRSMLMHLMHTHAAAAPSHSHLLDLATGRLTFSMGVNFLRWRGCRMSVSSAAGELVLHRQRYLSLYE
jgi:hypothetical protein